MDNPLATVVITTLYRHADLALCLQAVAAMNVKPERVLVIARVEDVDSHRIARLHGASVATVSEPGLAKAIETAISAVKTEVIAFVDDDARPHRDWLERIVRAFQSDPALGFVGGRDNVHGDTTSGQSSLTVGRLARGKLIGNHHLGKGTKRPAMHAKGANMAYRTEAVRDLPLGSLVRGTGAQHGNELFLGFAALSRGYAGAYDPSIQVDHFPAVRQKADERRNFTRDRIKADIRNSAGAIGLFLGPGRWLLYLTRAVTIGDRDRPGIVWSVVKGAKRQFSVSSFAAVVTAAALAPFDLRSLNRVAREAQTGKEDGN